MSDDPLARLFPSPRVDAAFGDACIVVSHLSGVVPVACAPSGPRLGMRPGCRTHRVCQEIAAHVFTMRRSPPTAADV